MQILYYMHINLSRNANKLSKNNKYQKKRKKYKKPIDKRIVFWYNILYYQKKYLVSLEVRSHPFPFRTRKLSSPSPKILDWRRSGKIGRCQNFCTPNRVVRKADRTVKVLSAVLLNVGIFKMWNVALKIWEIYTS